MLFSLFRGQQIDFVSVAVQIAAILIIIFLVRWVVPAAIAVIFIRGIIEIL